MANTKRPAPITSAPDIAISGDSLTIHPGGYTEDPGRIPTDSSEWLLQGKMARFRETPLEFLREFSTHMSATTGWRTYDGMIGQPLFFPGYTEFMKKKILDHEMVQKTLSDLAESRVKVEEAQGLFSKTDKNYEKALAARQAAIRLSIFEVAQGLMDRMICKYESKRFIQSAYWICSQVVTRAYHQGIHVSSEEALRLRAAAMECAKRKLSIVFLPSHRSHIDYVSLQLIYFRLGIALPTIVAGENLNFPLVGPFLQNGGGMFIRRSFSGDKLYSTLVQSYVDTLLRNGYNFECFIEGGRSRTGKLLPPKFGILNSVLDSVVSGRVEDVLMCPISIQYDKVIETESYITELLGKPKKKENLMDFMSSSSIFGLNFGRVDVRFHELWSLRDWINANQSRPGLNEVDKTMSLEEQQGHGKLLRSLGYRILSDINSVSVVMPTALIGCVLLTLRGRGVGKSEVVRRIEWLSDRIRVKGGRVAHFAGAPTEVVLERGIEVLGPNLVGKVDGLLEETYFAVDRFQLSFYRNMVIHLFINEALVSAGIYTRVKLGGSPDNQRITYKDLLEQVAFLSQRFRHEFIFPSEGIKINFEKTLNGLETDGVITVTRSASGEIEYVEISEQELSAGRENFDFYCFLIWPFIEAVWLGGVSLLGLTPQVDQAEPQWFPAKETENMAQLVSVLFAFYLNKSKLTITAW
jgi:1-acyl-sn-glycerol-3-phosphate acyltransferase